MIDSYNTAWLSPAECAQAYPLVRFAHPDWTLAAWVKRARRLGRRTPAHGGLMAVRDRRGIIHGFFSYVIDIDLSNDKCLRVSNLVFVRLPGSQIDEAILEGVERLAHESACDYLSIDVPMSASKNAMLDLRSLKSHQFEMRGAVFTRFESWRA